MEGVGCGGKKERKGKGGGEEKEGGRGKRKKEGMISVVDKSDGNKWKRKIV